MTFGDHLSVDKIRECMEAVGTIIAKFYAAIKTSFPHVIIYDEYSCTRDRRYVMSVPRCTNRSY